MISKVIKNIAILCVLVCWLDLAKGQELVTFKSSDGLLISADYYRSNKNNPTILLFHQAGYSRGEYKEIAPKLQKLGYNCLAVDLRSGNSVNFVRNETARQAKMANLPISYLDATKDIEASIAYVKTISDKSIILFGSSYSASLVLMEAAKRNDIFAAIAYSPGEYFQPEVQVHEQIKNTHIPTFVASTRQESVYTKSLLSETPSDLVTFYFDAEGKGEHGSKTLWETSPGYKDYWLRLMMFFNSLK